MKIVIDLGGNALGNTPKAQLEIVRESAKPIVDLIEDGHFAQCYIYYRAILFLD